MKRQRIFVSKVLYFAVGFAVTGVAGAARSDTPAYTVMDIAGGGGFGATAAFDVNSSGQVVGVVQDGSGQSRAFHWDPVAGLTLIGANPPSIAWGLNASGLVCGQGAGSQYAFAWSTFAGLAVLPNLPFANSSIARDVNDSGQVAGTGINWNIPDYRAMLWQSGTAIDIGAPAYSYAAGINNYGQVVGYASTAGYGAPDHAFLWTPTAPNGSTGQIADLGTFGGATSGSNKINSSGQVVGYAEDALGNARSFLWTPTSSNGNTGAMTDIGTVPGTDNGDAFGINDVGDVVGTCGLTRSFLAPRGFVYSAGQVHDLNDLIDPGLGWAIYAAYGINTARQIACAAFDANGVSHALLLTPVPHIDPLTITISSPANSTYLLNQPVTASYSCTGGVAPVMCTGTAPNNSLIDAASAGDKTFFVTVADGANNTLTKSVPYTVAYGTEALYDQAKAHKSGSTVPVKVKLIDFNGSNVSSATIVVHAVQTTLLSGTPTGLLDDSGSANPDNNFRYDASLGGYIFNLSLKGYAQGIYALHFTAGDDPSDHVVQFQVR